MAHFRRAVGAAAALNTAITVVEAVAGLQAHSLSLVVDAAHNLSDELALVCLYLAFYLPDYLGRQSQRTANVLNSAGLICLGAVVMIEAVWHLRSPAPVQGLVPVLVGVLAAAGNYGIARLLREPGQHHAAVRLAYLHNLGDVWVSLAPVLAGVLVTVTSSGRADALVALAIAAWLVVSTVREIRGSADELLWPERIACVHPEGRGSHASP